MFLKKISKLLVLFDPLGKVVACECIGLSLRCIREAAVEKVILDIFVKTHHHMLEGKHWQAPYHSVSSLDYLALDLFFFPWFRRVQSPEHANHKSQQFLHYSMYYLSVFSSGTWWSSAASACSFVAPSVSNNEGLRAGSQHGEGRRKVQLWGLKALFETGIQTLRKAAKGLW